MKKMNWGQGIAAFLIVFVLAIGLLVYKTTQSAVHLEDPNYYQKEIAYQEQIDANSNGKLIDPLLEMSLDKNDVVVSLDDDALNLDFNKGMVHFFRPNDSSLDKDFPLEFENGEYRIPVTQLVNGKYRVEFTWMSGESAYSVHRELYIP